MAIATYDVAWEFEIVISARDVEWTMSVSGRELVDCLEAVRGREVPVAIAWVATFGFLGQGGKKTGRRKGGVDR